MELRQIGGIGAPLTVLALTGQVQTQVFGPGAFQDIDLKSAFDTVSTFSQPVLATSNHAELMSLACKNANVEQNVAYLIFPDDVQTIPSDKPAASPVGRMGGTRVVPAQGDIDAAVALLNSAKRPMIVVGHGAYGARDQIIALAEKIGAPVVTTFKAKGLVAERFSLAAIRGIAEIWKSGLAWNLRCAGHEWRA